MPGLLLLVCILGPSASSPFPQLVSRAKAPTTAAAPALLRKLRCSSTPPAAISAVGYSLPCHASVPAPPLIPLAMLPARCMPCCSSFMSAAAPPPPS